jgi:hypothetical protein
VQTMTPRSRWWLHSSPSHGSLVLWCKIGNFFTNKKAKCLILHNKTNGLLLDENSNHHHMLTSSSDQNRSIPIKSDLSTIISKRMKRYSTIHRPTISKTDKFDHADSRRDGPWSDKSWISQDFMQIIWIIFFVSRNSFSKRFEIDIRLNGLPRSNKNKLCENMIFQRERVRFGDPGQMARQREKPTP